MFAITKRVMVFLFGLTICTGICYALMDNQMPANFYRFIDNRGYLIEGLYPISDEIAKKVNCYHFIYDKDGRPIIIEHLKNGRISSDLPTSFLAKIVIDYSTPAVQKRIYQDVNGKPTSNEQGVFSTKLRIDNRNKQVQSFTYDASGQLAEDRFGIAERLSLLDDNGKAIKSLELFDKSHNKLVNKDGVAYQYWFKYDQNGQVIEGATQGEDGQLVEGKNGTAKTAFKYDNQGNLIETDLYGINNDLTEGNEYGTAIMRFKYDDEGNRVEDSFYGAYGQQEKNKYGVGVTKYVYDENGNLIEARDYGINNELVENSQDGIAIHRWKYDSKGDAIETSNLGIDNKLKNNSDGWAIYQDKYDSSGYIAEQSFLDLNGKLTNGKRGWAVIRCKVDEKGNAIEKATYGEDGRLIEDRGGVAIRQFKYDDKNNVIEEDDFGVINGQPKTKIRFLYDENGRKIKESSYNADEQLKEDAYGVATYRFKYNDTDGTMQVSYYGVNDESKTSGGFSSVVVKYDDDRKQGAVIKKYPSNQQEGGVEAQSSPNQYLPQANNPTNETNNAGRDFARTNDIMFALSPQVTTPPDENTLFSLDEMQVMQSADGGALMRVMPGMGQDTDIIAFLYTDENFVDDVRLAGYWAYYVGTYQYQTILGVQKNIYAFRLYDKNRGFDLTKKMVEAQNERNQINNVQMAAQNFVSKQLANNCVQYWANATQQRSNSSIFSLFNRPNISPTVCINGSMQFYSQPTITKTGDYSWEVTSYVEGQDGTLRVPIVRVSFTVDFTIPPNQEAVLNSIKFYNKVNQNRSYVTSQNGYTSVAP